MRPRLVALPVIVCLLPSVLAAQDDTAVVKYVGAKEGRAWSRPAMIVIVAPRDGRGTAELLVPNRNPEGRTLDPDPVVVNIVRDLKPGDLIEVRTGKLEGHNILRSIRPYKPKPGEDDPEAFTFVRVVEQKVGNQDVLGVELKKDAASQTVPVPNRTDDNGKPVPDPELAAKVRSFAKGDLVEVKVAREAGKIVLASIKAYKPPDRGKFVKSLEQKVEEEAFLAIEVAQDDQTTKTLLVPNHKDAKGQNVPDAELSAAVKKLRPGQTVLFRTRQDGQKTFLTEARAALF